MDAISKNSKLFSEGKQGKLSRVVVYLVDNGTSGPVARAAKISRELADAGADVTILMPKSLAGSKLFANDIRQIPYDAERMWRPSRLSPQLQIARIKPDHLVIGEYPFVAKEHAYVWEPVIDMAKRVNRKCKVDTVTSDIPVYYKDAESVNLPKRAARIDHIWVTGDPNITDFNDYVADEAKPHIASKISYAGFMERPPVHQDNANLTLEDGKKEIVIYLGGMNLSKLASRYLSLIANLPLLSTDLQEAHWRFIMPESGDMGSANKIATAVSHLPEALQEHISIEPADAHFKDKLERAAMVITGGGQSAVESALVQGKPTVILPGFFGDQFVRAKDFAARFPGQVAACDLPTLNIPAMTAKRLRYNMMCGTEEADWLTQTFEWAKKSPECAHMRSAFEEVFAGSGNEYPRPEIMLDGAHRIAGHVLAQSITAKTNPRVTPFSSLWGPV